MAYTDGPYPEEKSSAAPPLDDKVANLRDHVDRLNHFIEMLEKRLQSVLRPEEPTGVTGGDIAAVRAASPTVDRLDSIDVMLVAAIDRIGAIKDRLDT